MLSYGVPRAYKPAKPRIVRGSMISRDKIMPEMNLKDEVYSHSERILPIFGKKPIQPVSLQILALANSPKVALKIRLSSANKSNTVESTRGRVKLSIQTRINSTSSQSRRTEGGGWDQTDLLSNVTTTHNLATQLSQKVLEPKPSPLKACIAWRLPPRKNLVLKEPSFTATPPVSNPNNGAEHPRMFSFF